MERVSRDSVHLRYRERTTVLIPMTYELVSGIHPCVVN